MKITACIIGPGASAALFNMSEPKAATVTFEDGSTTELFEFYSDEIRFTADEIVGLTADEARALHRDRDIAWLRS